MSTVRNWWAAGALGATALLFGCGNSTETATETRPERVQSAELTTTTTTTAATPPSTRLVSVKSVDPQFDPLKLVLLVNACNPEIASIDVDEVETDTTVTVTISEFFTPPTSNALGEFEAVTECSSSVSVDLAQPLDDRDLIDGSTGAVFVPGAPG